MSYTPFGGTFSLSNYAPIDPLNLEIPQLYTLPQISTIQSSSRQSTDDAPTQAAPSPVQRSSSVQVTRSDSHPKSNKYIDKTARRELEEQRQEQKRRDVAEMKKKCDAFPSYTPTPIDTIKHPVACAATSATEQREPSPDNNKDDEEEEENDLIAIKRKKVIGSGGEVLPTPAIKPKINIKKECGVPDVEVVVLSSDDESEPTPQTSQPMKRELDEKTKKDEELERSKAAMTALMNSYSKKDDRQRRQEALEAERRKQREELIRKERECAELRKKIEEDENKERLEKEKLRLMVEQQKKKEEEQRKREEEEKKRAEEEKKKQEEEEKRKREAEELEKLEEELRNRAAHTAEMERRRDELRMKQQTKTVPETTELEEIVPDRRNKERKTSNESTRKDAKVANGEDQEKNQRQKKRTVHISTSTSSDISSQPESNDDIICCDDIPSTSTVNTINNSRSNQKEVKTPYGGNNKKRNIVERCVGSDTTSESDSDESDREAERKKNKNVRRSTRSTTPVANSKTINNNSKKKTNKFVRIDIPTESSSCDSLKDFIVSDTESLIYDTPPKSKSKSREKSVEKTRKHPRNRRRSSSSDRRSVTPTRKRSKAGVEQRRTPVSDVSERRREKPGRIEDRMNTMGSSRSSLSTDTGDRPHPSYKDDWDEQRKKNNRTLTNREFSRETNRKLDVMIHEKVIGPLVPLSNLKSKTNSKSRDLISNILRDDRKRHGSNDGEAPIQKKRTTFDEDDEPSCSAPPKRISHATSSGKPTSSLTPSNPVKKRPNQREMMETAAKEAAERRKQQEIEEKRLKQQKFLTQEQQFGQKSSRIGSTAKGETRVARPSNPAPIKPRSIVKTEPGVAPSKRINLTPPQLLEPFSRKISSQTRNGGIKKIFDTLHATSPMTANDEAQKIELELMRSANNNTSYAAKIVNWFRNHKDNDVIPISKNTISHDEVMAGRHYSNITVANHKKEQLTFETMTDEQIHTILLLLEMTPEELRKNAYPMYLNENDRKVHIEPTTYTKNKPCWINPGDLKRFCSRCNKEFRLNPDGTMIREKGICRYHNRAINREGKKQTFSKKYLCCNEEVNTAPGCKFSNVHVFDQLYTNVLSRFVKTPNVAGPNDPRTNKAYAIDCEMVYTMEGPALARLSVVDMRGKLVLDVKVKPPHEVLDPNTEFSGLTMEDIENATDTLQSCHQKFFKLVNNATFLIGHSLDSDLKALRLVHKKVVDTSVLFAEGEFKMALRKLASKYLSKLIQCDNEDAEGHDSYEDAKVCVDLLSYALKNPHVITSRSLKLTTQPSTSSS